MEILTHISLFTGIGGIDLAAEWAGFKTILMVENNAYCQKVLKKHWPDVPIIGDIKDVTKEAVENAQCQRWCRRSEEGGEVLECQVTKDKIEGRYILAREGADNQSPVALITGGFPCQPVSQAGKRRGKEDDRWLWPEMLRVISEVRPTWVVAENVLGLLTMGFYDCLSDLEGEGYETIPFVIPACGVNAPHRRNRIFIVAHTNTTGIGRNIRGSNRRERHLLSDEGIAQEGKSAGQRWERGIGEACSDVADSNCSRLEESLSIIPGVSERCGGRREPSFKDQWSVEPDVGRVAHGISHRVDRLKGLGNAVVPQQIYPILQAIADIEL